MGVLPSSRPGASAGAGRAGRAVAFGIPVLQAAGVRCHACNAAVPLAAGERVGFRDVCESCDADLHACLNCAHHDPASYNECREPNAEWVSERDRANRCDYFAPGDRSGGAGSGPDDARNALDALFKK